MQRIVILISTLGLAVLACTATRNPIEPTPLPPTLTPNLAATEAAILPSPTASLIPTETVTATPSPTETATAIPTNTSTPQPTSTALPTMNFANDNTNFVEIPEEIQSGLDQAWFSFTITEDDPSDDTDTVLQTVYLARPDNGQLLRIIDLPPSTDNRVFWSPTGLHMAYFLESDENNPNIGGLYLLNIQSGRSIRVYQSDTLQPRGIVGHQPVWSPNGTRLAFVLPTAYATDIYLINADGTGFTNLTNTPSYDFWPSWSADGRKLAFVSDRISCPTWIPNEAETCDHLNVTPPIAGKLFIYDFTTEKFSNLTDSTLNSPPTWINETYLSVSEGSLDPLASLSTLWIYDVDAGSAWPITPSDSALYANPAWSSTGNNVVFQRSSDTSTVVLADRLGNIIDSLDEYIFSRFGLAASWSPDGELVALGGSIGQCSQGLIVLDATFNLVTAPVESVLACDPLYDPQGNYLAYVGIQLARGTDGRLDVYIANTRGQGRRNLTSSFEGQIQVLGWVGPTFEE